MKKTKKQQKKRYDFPRIGSFFRRIFDCRLNGNSQYFKYPQWKYTLFINYIDIASERRMKKKKSYTPNVSKCVGKFAASLQMNGGKQKEWWKNQQKTMFLMLFLFVSFLILFDLLSGFLFSFIVSFLFSMMTIGREKTQKKIVKKELWLFALFLYVFLHSFCVA